MSDPVTLPSLSSSLDLEQDFPFATLLQVLEYCFDMHCHFPALCSDDQAISYYQLDEASTAFAAYLQEWVKPDDEKIAITSRCSLFGAVAFCGAIRAGVSVVFPEPSSIDRQSRFYSENRIRLLVAMNSDMFCSRYLKRFFTPEEQVITLDRLGRIERAEKFSGVLGQVSPKEWQRPLSNQQRKLEILRMSQNGVLSGCSQQELLSQVKSLYRQSQSCDDASLDQVSSFLKILVQLLQGKQIEFSRNILK